MVNTNDMLASSSSSSQGALANLSSSNSSSERKGRRSKQEIVEWTDAQLASLTGNENVPVIHRESGKKVGI